jgi:hypothetical protein
MGHEDVVSVLQSHGVEIDKARETCLGRAIYFIFFDKVKVFSVL